MNTKNRESQEKDFSKDKRKEEKPFTEEVNPNSTVDLLEVVEFSYAQNVSVFSPDKLRRARYNKGSRDSLRYYLPKIYEEVLT